MNERSMNDILEAAAVARDTSNVAALLYLQLAVMASRAMFEGHYKLLVDNQGNLRLPELTPPTGG